MQRLQEFVKYTKKELDSYAETKGSCVYKINQNLHFAINAYILNDMNAALPAYILKNRVGYYDESLNGIILAVKNIKVLNGAAAMRFDDPKLHIEINADCYVFRPAEGAILTGIPKHIGKHHVGIIIYGVFNASIRLDEAVNKAEVKLNQELKFQVKNFNIRIAHPYIQGTLLNIKCEKDIAKKKTIETKRITFKSDDEEDSNDDNNDVNNQTPDSGIEEKNSNDRDMELDELLSFIKNEPVFEPDMELNSEEHHATSRKRERKTTESFDEELPPAKIKIKSEPSKNEPVFEPDMELNAEEHHATPRKRERKTTESFDEELPPASIKIKSEPSKKKQISENSMELSDDSHIKIVKIKSEKRKIKKEKHD